MRGLVGAWTVGAMVAWGCGGTASEPRPPVVDGPPSHTEQPPPTNGVPSPGVGTPPGTPPVAGTPPGGGTSPGGSSPGGSTPGKTPTEPTPPVVTEGPWPNVPVLNYSHRYKLGTVRGVGVDDAYNLWLLNGDEIGVLRPGDKAPRWTKGVGQAAPGFGPDLLAQGSSVICGGSAGRAYVGYLTYDLDPAFIYSPDGRSFPQYDDPDPARYDSVRYQEYKKGDLDVVRLEADGTVKLEEHLSRSVGENGPRDIGIRNTNDHHFDEDRSVLTCVKVMRGRHRGDIYIGTNHGVTRIQGLVYNSHRHPVWFTPGGTQKAGYTYALGISPDGDVLIGNDWKVGVVTPSDRLADWDRVDQALTPEKVNAHLPEVNSLEDKDFWRGIQQTVDGRYYLASKDQGLWQMHIVRRTEARGVKVTGLPTEQLTALAATDDGSLFIGTRGFGLWRMNEQKQLTHVPEVEGTVVEQLLYDPTVKPAMLYVLTNAGLTVLRGH